MSAAIEVPDGPTQGSRRAATTCGYRVVGSIGSAGVVRDWAARPGLQLALAAVAEERKGGRAAAAVAHATGSGGVIDCGVEGGSLVVEYGSEDG